MNAGRLGRVLTLTNSPVLTETRRRPTAYDGGGSLAAIVMPDPRRDDGADPYRYDYRHDGLQRLTKFRRPDGSES